MKRDGIFIYLNQFYKCLLTDDSRIFEESSFEFVKNFGNLIEVKGGEKNICSCGYSSQRYWTNDSSSNIFPAGKVCPGVTPQREKRTRRHTDHPRKASARNGNRMSVFLSGIMNYEIDSLNMIVRLFTFPPD